jgi:Ca2+-binding EF-hand superfamily protein
VFKEVDKDNSKELNRFELGELLQRLGVPYAYDAAKVAALMQAIDTDQNKTCSFSELKKAVDEYRKKNGGAGARAGAR